MILTLFMSIKVAFSRLSFKKTLIKNQLHHYSSQHMK